MLIFNKRKGYERKEGNYEKKIYYCSINTDFGI